MVNTTLEQDANTIYFSIDSDYYQTKYKNRYVKYFKNELMGLDRNNKPKESFGNLFFFENGNFIKAYEDLPNE